MSALGCCGSARFSYTAVVWADSQQMVSARMHGWQLETDGGRAKEAERRNAFKYTAALLQQRAPLLHVVSVRGQVTVRV